MPDTSDPSALRDARLLLQHYRLQTEAATIRSLSRTRDDPDKDDAYWFESAVQWHRDSAAKHNIPAQEFEDSLREGNLEALRERIKLTGWVEDLKQAERRGKGGGFILGVLACVAFLALIDSLK
jgi:hypothetical protein